MGGNRRVTGAVLALILWCGAAQAQNTGNLSAEEAKADAAIKAAMQQRHIPGLSVAVVRNGKPVFMKGYGLANVELAVPATKDTLYQLASVTKQFTAAATLMLVQEGKLALDEKIPTYLPDLPAAWKNVTVRHLLTHTSGIKSYTSIPAFVMNMRLDFTRAQIIKYAADAPIEFAPGTKWNYNNTGYFLLGMLIEKASGKSYNDFLSERIFQPLGMTHTRLNSMEAILPNRASGYTAGNPLKNALFVPPGQPFAAGALVSTVEDMTKWDAALASDRLLPVRVREQMWTPVKLTDGKTAPYGFGWAVGKINGKRVVGHSGGIPGFSTHTERYLDDKLTVIVLCNLDGGNAEDIASKIAACYLPSPVP